jgi:hypothetical protein
VHYLVRTCRTLAEHPYLGVAVKRKCPTPPRCFGLMLYSDVVCCAMQCMNLACSQMLCNAGSNGVATLWHVPLWYRLGSIAVSVLSSYGLRVLTNTNSLGVHAWTSHPCGKKTYEKTTHPCHHDASYASLLMPKEETSTATANCTPRSACSP